MSVKVPKGAREKIKELVYVLADEHDYLSRTRVENSEFMRQLLEHPEIGEVLREFMPRDRVKTYIKDSLLNAYSKLRRRPPEDIDSHLKSFLGDTTGTIEYDAKDGVSLHRMVDGSLALAARTGYLKWETGLRKLLLFVARAKGLPPKDGTKLHLVLLILQNDSPVNSSDRKTVEEALRPTGVICVWA